MQSIVEQAAELIREGIRGGRWSNELPGRVTLAKELGVSPATAGRASDLLTQEGILESQGPNRRRRITNTRQHSEKTPFHATLIPFSEAVSTDPCMITLAYELERLGVKTRRSQKTLDDLNSDLPRLMRIIKKQQPDAWVIQGGTQPILEWFSTQDTPSFALGGGMRGVDIAGAGFDSAEMIHESVGRLIELGHTRIVFVDYAYRNTPIPDPVISLFLDALRNHGIPVGPYNHPQWDGSDPGLQECLKRLFEYTPPTALFFRDSVAYRSAKNFLDETKRRVPQDVSLVCISDHTHFKKDVPSPSFATGDTLRLVDPVIQWTKKIISGVFDRRQVRLPLVFVEGDSMGPVKK